MNCAFFWSAVRSHRRYALFAVGLLLIGFAVGFVVDVPGNANGESDDANPYGIDRPTTTAFALNNGKVALQLLAGAVMFGLTAFIGLVFNGLALGSLVATALERTSDYVFIALLVGPHGIFEIPALLMAAAVGFRVPHQVVRYLRGERDELLDEQDVKQAAFLAVVSSVRSGHRGRHGTVAGARRQRPTVRTRGDDERGVSCVGRTILRITLRAVCCPVGHRVERVTITARRDTSRSSAVR